MFLSILQLTLVTLLPALLARLVFNYTRLRSIPGPFLACLTDLWRWHSQNKALFYGPTLTALHMKYGPLVRIGPNLVSISDPSAIGIVYGTSPVFKKGPSYDIIIGLSQGNLVHSLITMSEAQHSVVIKGVGAAFTPNAILDYEPFIDESAAQLMSALRKHPTVDITTWLQLFAMDVLNRVTFGESPGFLEKEADIEGMLATVENRFEYWHVWGAMPGLEYLIYKNPIMRWMASPVNTLARIANEQFRKRREEGEGKEHKDLLQKYMDGRARYPEDISETNVVGLIVSSIAAGADTTATTLISVLFFLMKYPSVLERLDVEIQAAIREGNVSATPRWTEVHKLAYLDAVIKESMRYFPIIAFGLDRVVPEGGRQIAGTFLPAGTVVACHNESIHHDSDIYGPHADKFRPERWLDADEEQLKRMDRAFLGFGAGKRICPGRHIAMLEMKKLVPLLVMNFKMRLDDQEDDFRDRVKLNTVKYSPPIMATFEERSLN